MSETYVPIGLEEDEPDSNIAAASGSEVAIALASKAMGGGHETTSDDQYSFARAVAKSLGLSKHPNDDSATEDDLTARAEARKSMREIIEAVCKRAKILDPDETQASNELRALIKYLVLELPLRKSLEGTGVAEKRLFELAERVYRRLQEEDSRSQT